MTLSCETCGGCGNRMCLVMCLQCDSAAVHRYCLPELKLGDDQVTWNCEQCEIKYTSLSDNQIIASRDSKDLKVGSHVDINDWDHQSRTVKEIERQNMSSTCQPTKANESSDVTKKVEKKRRIRKLILGEEFMDQLAETHEAHVNIDKDGSCRLESKSAKKDLVVLEGLAIHEGKGATEMVTKKRRRRKLILEEECLDEVVKPKEDHVNNNIDKFHNNSRLENNIDIKETLATETSFDKDLVQPFSTEGAVLTNISINQISVEVFTYMHARPESYPIWSGCFKVCDYEYGEVQAHLSDKAGDRALQEARNMPAILCVKVHSRLDVWPKSFQVSPPNDERIALYFFPKFGKNEEKFTSLLDEIISCDLALRVLLDTSELLLFSFLLLPEHCFLQKRFLWGAFKKRSDAASFQTDGKTAARSSSTAGNGGCQQGKEMGRQSHRCRSADSAKSITLAPARRSDDSYLQELESHKETEKHYTDEAIPDNVLVSFGADTSRGQHMPKNVSLSICDTNRAASSVSVSSRVEAHCSSPDFDDVQDDTEACLNLFPVMGEDLAIMVKIGNDSGINLDMGLGSFGMQKEVDKREPTIGVADAR